MNRTAIKSYSDAKNYLGDKLSRPFAHNTRIKADDMGHERIVVTYHDNPIVALYPDRISFNTCGWYTSTTKERLNWFMPEGWRLYQERGNWIVWDGKHKYNFADGIVFCNGAWYDYAPDSKQDEINARTKQIKKYVTGFVAALLAGEVSHPSGGDCWYCLLRDNDNKPMGEVFINTDHLESHFWESYYVPSLLVNACESFPVCIMTKDGIARLWEGESISDWQKDVIKRDITSSLTRYLKRQFGIAS